MWEPQVLKLKVKIFFFWKKCYPEGRKGNIREKLLDMMPRWSHVDLSNLRYKNNDLMKVCQLLKLKFKFSSWNDSGLCCLTHASLLFGTTLFKSQSVFYGLRGYLKSYVIYSYIKIWRVLLRTGLSHLNMERNMTLSSKLPEG